MKISTDRAHLPPWTLTLSVRGIDVPTLHPYDCADATITMVMPDKRRWPGLFVWAWRIVFGAPRRPEQPPADIEKQATLRVCRALLAPNHHALLDSLSDGELLTIVQTYIGCQQVWADEVKRIAGATQRETLGSTAAPAATPTVVDEAGGGASRLLRSGFPLPAHMGGESWGARRTAEQAAKSAHASGGDPSLNGKAGAPAV